MKKRKRKGEIRRENSKKKIVTKKKGKKIRL